MLDEFAENRKAEEREAIVAWLEAQTSVDRMGSRHPYVAETLRWAASEIRDGAHQEGEE